MMMILLYHWLMFVVFVAVTWQFSQFFVTNISLYYKEILCILT